MGNQPRGRAEHWGPETGLSSWLVLVKLPVTCTMHPPEAEEGREEGETSGVSKAGFCQSSIPQDRKTLLAAGRRSLQPCVNCACPRGLGTAYQPSQCSVGSHVPCDTFD